MESIDLKLSPEELDNSSLVVELKSISEKILSVVSGKCLFNIVKFSGYIFLYTYNVGIIVTKESI